MTRTLLISMLVAGGLMYLPVPSRAQANCPNLPATDQEPFESSQHAVKWLAAADPIGGDMYVARRYVHNLGDQPRHIYWPKGRMAVASLSPDHWVRRCSFPGESPRPAAGPLFIFSHATPIDTVVYELMDELQGISHFQDGISNAVPLSVTTRFEMGVSEGRIVKGILFTSQVAPHEEQGHEYSYTLRRTGQDPIRVQVGGLPPSVLSQLGEDLIQLSEDENTRSASVAVASASALPLPVLLPVTIVADGGVVTGRTEVRAMVPQPGWAE